MQRLDPYQRPPARIRNAYKKYQKMKLQELDQDQDIIDLSDNTSSSSNPKIRMVKELKYEHLEPGFEIFAGSNWEADSSKVPAQIPIFEHELLPGLYILPTLFPPPIQTLLLSRLLHRDLCNPTHLTNIHTHYSISYPPSSTSFFSIPPSSLTTIATPLDPTVHKPLTIAPFLNKKLRWTTLGGQYDWTAKRYPEEVPPAFPVDIKKLLEAVFTDTKAEAAIVNLYSPGDTLSVHRDVAETSDTGLISVSLGCDAVFVVGTSAGSDGEGNDCGDEERILTLRLRSGSALYMSGASRFAWHGVPQIVGGTCPNYLRDWPVIGQEGGNYEEWKGWMTGKRVNLNVRQMWE